MSEGFGRINSSTGVIYDFSWEPFTVSRPGQSGVSLGNVPRTPDFRTKRYNGAGGLKDATVQEVEDWDDNKRDEEAQAILDSNLALKTIILWAADRFAITPGDARSEIVAKFKQLASP